MPYRKFQKTVKGRRKYCTKNKRTGQVVCYQSDEARRKGIRIREAYAHGWKPSRVRGK